MPTTNLAAALIEAAEGFPAAVLAALTGDDEGLALAEEDGGLDPALLRKAAKGAEEVEDLSALTLPDPLPFEGEYDADEGEVQAWRLPDGSIILIATEGWDQDPTEAIALPAPS